MVTDHDEKLRYCRMLGHEVPFSYCREPGGVHFCRHIVNCWFERFDVEGFLSANYSAEEIAEALKPPVPRIESLLSLIERAKESTSQAS
jgi:hypothetical protein